MTCQNKTQKVNQICRSQGSEINSPPPALHLLPEERNYPPLRGLAREDLPAATARMLYSLEGLSVGDAFGKSFSFNHPEAAIQKQQLQGGFWSWTDDTHMAVSIVEILQDYGEINQEKLAQRFAERYQRLSQANLRGYGPGVKHILAGINAGQPWQKNNRAYLPTGSFGNGAAMRVPPLGAFFAEEKDFSRVATATRLSAEITHCHPEGIAGAIAVAGAAYVAAQTIYPQGRDFLQAVRDMTPQSEVRTRLDLARKIPADQPLTTVVTQLGSGQKTSCQDTVPFCLWIAAHHQTDYENALWTTVAGLGDRDTTCAIVGGIVALTSRKIPPTWLDRREPLPDYLLAKF